MLKSGYLIYPNRRANPIKIAEVLLHIAALQLTEINAGRQSFKFFSGNLLRLPGAVAGEGLFLRDVTGAR